MIKIMRTSADILSLDLEYLLLMFGVFILVCGVFSCCYGFFPNNDEENVPHPAEEQNLEWDNRID